MCKVMNSDDATVDAIDHILSGKPFVMMIETQIDNAPKGTRTIFKDLNSTFLNELDGELTRTVQCWNTITESKIANDSGE
jgi:hypothetical protein